MSTRLWYLARHPVFHSLKPDKVRINHMITDGVLCSHYVLLDGKLIIHSDEVPCLICCFMALDGIYTQCNILIVPFYGRNYVLVVRK